MSSAGILEIVVPEKAQSTLVVPTPEIPTSESAVGAHKEEESQTKPLLIGALILGAAMLSGMGGTLLIWTYLR